MVRKIKIGRIEVSFSDRWLYTFIALGIIILLGVVVYGWSNSAGVGHGLDEIQPCGEGEILKTSSGSWSCVDAPIDTNTNANTECPTGQYLDGDGNCDTALDIVLKALEYKPGEYLEASSGIISCNSYHASWVKRWEVKLQRSGEIRIRIGIAGCAHNRPVYGWVKVNGVNVLYVDSNEASWRYNTGDFSVSRGDTVELWTRNYDRYVCPGAGLLEIKIDTPII